MEDIKTILDRIRKPLVFASRDNFAHIASLSGIEPFMRKQIEDLRQVSKENRRIDAFEKLFADFDNLPVDQKKGRIAQATELISTFEQSRSFSKPVLSRSKRTASQSFSRMRPQSR